MSINLSSFPFSPTSPPPLSPAPPPPLLPSSSCALSWVARSPCFSREARRLAVCRKKRRRAAVLASARKMTIEEIKEQEVEEAPPLLEELLVMCQVETAAGLAEIEAIAGVEGVDVVQMEPLDLSASIGYLWDPRNRKVRDAMKEAERKVLGMRNKLLAAEGGGAGERGPYLGGLAMPHDRAENMKMRGYHMVTGAMDVGIFRQAAVEDVQRRRSAEVDIGEETRKRGSDSK